MTHFRHWSLMSAGVLAFTLGLGTPVRAAAPETAPAELVESLEQIESAANAQDLDGVMSFYDTAFTNEDGFTYDTLADALATLWERYDTVTYKIELQSWEPTATGYIAETVTHIDGTTSQTRSADLESVIRSRQTYEDNQIVSQAILSERNQLTAGQNPPTVTVILPERVAPDEAYEFDAIVEEPIGDNYLLGVALDEGTTAEDFFTARPIDLELLAAGGLFKIGDAPTSEDNLWISGLLIRDDGLVVITRRLRVE
ncbi:MAG: nuclear transport factor 2 family protein [Cyanobacteria bacterium P01_A01_bin.105]